MSMGKQDKAQRKWGLFVIIFALAAGVAAGMMLAWGENSVPPAILFAALVVICALAMLAMLPWWRRLDDMQKAAQYESWWWGGTAGTALGLAGLIAFFGAQSVSVRGAMTLLFVQMACFAFYWIYWRIRNGGGGL